MNRTSHTYLKKSKTAMMDCKSIIYFIYKSKIESGVVAEWLRAHSTLAEDKL